MTRHLPVALLASLTLTTALRAQSPASEPSPSSLNTETETTEKAEPRELRTLIFDEAQYAFVDPESREPYTGPITVTYPSGQLETEGQLVDGLEDGYFIEYYPDGTKSGMGTYRAGDEVGPWTYWWENGRIESEGSFKDGRLDGVWRDYHPDGKLANEGAYVDGLAQGKWQMTDDETNKLTVVYYDKGEEVPPPSEESEEASPIDDAKADTASSADASPTASPTVDPDATPTSNEATPTPGPKASAPE